ncbi:unnamed protein product [Heterobilharzia americana]|nr:unnamed protein product [Heterobilharzia americana]
MQNIERNKSQFLSVIQFDEEEMLRYYFIHINQKLKKLESKEIDKFKIIDKISIQPSQLIIIYPKIDRLNGIA